MEKLHKTAIIMNQFDRCRQDFNGYHSVFPYNKDSRHDHHFPGLTSVTLPQIITESLGVCACSTTASATNPSIRIIH
jgi:hypothetical protein